MTWIDGLWGLFTIAASTGGSWLIARRTVNAERASNAHVAAVDKLLPSVASLRSLLHQAAAQKVQPEDVRDAVNEFEALCMQHDVALPLGLRSVRHDVRAAVGNYFGGVSLAALDVRMSYYPLSDPHPYWRDISLSYVEYVMAQLQLSLLAPKTSGMRHFHEWRSDEDQCQR